VRPQDVGIFIVIIQQVKLQKALAREGLGALCHGWSELFFFHTYVDD
jgi:hypothetical protein